MSNDDAHWDAVWLSKRPEELSWHQRAPEPCASIVRRVTPPCGTIAVIGAGASPLVGLLAGEGFLVIAIDVSAVAIRLLAARIADARGIEFVVGDAGSIIFDQQLDTWHDRAVLHFRTDQGEQQRYAASAADAVRPGGHLVVATFAPKGPNHCSGLPVARHDADSLRRLFDRSFELTEAFEAEHCTPLGTSQRFTHATLRRLDP